MGDLVDIGGHEPTFEEIMSDTDDASEMEAAIENVASAVCGLWEVTGSDSASSVVTEVDGCTVRITVNVELI